MKHTSGAVSSSRGGATPCPTPYVPKSSAISCESCASASSTKVDLGWVWAALALAAVVGWFDFGPTLAVGIMTGVAVLHVAASRGSASVRRTRA